MRYKGAIRSRLGLGKGRLEVPSASRFAALALAGAAGDASLVQRSPFTCGAVSPSKSTAGDGCKQLLITHKVA